MKIKLNFLRRAEGKAEGWAEGTEKGPEEASYF